METKLKAIRAGNRAAVTKLWTKFEELKENPDNVEVEEVKAIEDAVTQKKKILHDLNEKMIEVLHEDHIEDEITDSDEYMFNLDSKLRQIQKLTQTINSSNNTSDLKEKSTTNANAECYIPRSNTCYTNTSAIYSLNTRERIPSEENPTGNQSRNFPGQNLQTYNNQEECSYIQPPAQPPNIFSNNHRLPKLDLPHFDGDVLQWSTFWDSYESTIHYNSSLTPIQKFSYLKAQLIGSAAQTIAGFALTNANYETAVCLLRERFGHPQKIINTYMKALMDLPSPSNDLNSLRMYGDYLETYVRGLECLGQTQEMYGALLVPIIISKLPAETRKSIAREYDSDHINLSNLRKAITKEVKILEAGQFTDRDRLHATATFLTEARNNTQRNFNTNNARYSDKKRPCIYCTGVHFPGDCTIISDVNARLNIVKQKKKCFNCLGKHGVSECKSRNRCKKCNKKHHTSICGGQATDGKGQDNKEKSAVVSLIKTEEPETAVMYTSQQHTSVLLKTAIAPVSYGKQTTEARILFDEGAQRSFITQSIAEKLQINPSGRDTIELSAFGDTEKNIRHLDTATVQLQTDKGEIVNINALIVPDIAVPLQNQMKYLTRNLPYLKDLKLAHPVNNADSFEISLLIGADYYWDIVQDHVIRGNGPTAVASKIGYLLSGPITKNEKKSSTSSVLLNVISPQHAEESDIEMFWNQEPLGKRLSQHDDEERFTKSYQQRHRQEFDQNQIYASVRARENCIQKRTTKK